MQKPSDEWRRDVEAAMDHIVLLSSSEADADELKRHYHTLRFIRDVFSPDSAPEG